MTPSQLRKELDEREREACRLHGRIAKLEAKLAKVRECLDMPHAKHVDKALANHRHPGRAMTPDELRTFCRLQARYAVLEAEWQAMQPASSWHDAWGLANALAWLVMAVLLSTGWKSASPRGLTAAMLMGLGSLVAQSVVWWRGHRARKLILSEYQRTNEELERLVEAE